MIEVDFNKIVGEAVKSSVTKEVEKMAASNKALATEIVNALSPLVTLKYSVSESIDSILDDQKETRKAILNLVSTTPLSDPSLKELADREGKYAALLSNMSKSLDESSAAMLKNSGAFTAVTSSLLDKSDLKEVSLSKESESWLERTIRSFDNISESLYKKLSGRETEVVPRSSEQIYKDLKIDYSKDSEIAESYKKALENKGLTKEAIMDIVSKSVNPLAVAMDKSLNKSKSDIISPSYEEVTTPYDDTEGYLKSISESTDLIAKSLKEFLRKDHQTEAEYAKDKEKAELKDTSTKVPKKSKSEDKPDSSKDSDGESSFWGDLWAGKGFGNALKGLGKGLGMGSAAKWLGRVGRVAGRGAARAIPAGLVAYGVYEAGKAAYDQYQESEKLEGDNMLNKANLSDEAKLASGTRYISLNQKIARYGDDGEREVTDLPRVLAMGDTKFNASFYTKDDSKLHTGQISSYLKQLAGHETGGIDTRYAYGMLPRSKSKTFGRYQMGLDALIDSGLFKIDKDNDPEAAKKKEALVGIVNGLTVYGDKQQALQNKLSRAKTDEDKKVAEEEIQALYKEVDSFIEKNKGVWYNAQGHHKKVSIRQFINNEGNIQDLLATSYMALHEKGLRMTRKGLKGDPDENGVMKDISYMDAANALGISAVNLLKAAHHSGLGGVQRLIMTMYEKAKGEEYVPANFERVSDIDKDGVSNYQYLAGVQGLASDIINGSGNIHNIKIAGFDVGSLSGGNLIDENLSYDVMKEYLKQSLSGYAKVQQEDFKKHFEEYKESIKDDPANSARLRNTNNILKITQELIDSNKITLSRKELSDYSSKRVADRRGRGPSKKDIEALTEDLKAFYAIDKDKRLNSLGDDLPVLDAAKYEISDEGLSEMVGSDEKKIETVNKMRELIHKHRRSLLVEDPNNWMLKGMTDDELVMYYLKKAQQGTLDVGNYTDFVKSYFAPAVSATTEHDVHLDNLADKVMEASPQSDGSILEARLLRESGQMTSSGSRATSDLTMEDFLNYADILSGKKIVVPQPEPDNDALSTQGDVQTKPVEKENQEPVAQAPNVNNNTSTIIIPQFDSNRNPYLPYTNNQG